MEARVIGKELNDVINFLSVTLSRDPAKQHDVNLCLSTIQEGKCDYPPDQKQHRGYRIISQ